MAGFVAHLAKTLPLGGLVSQEGNQQEKHQHRRHAEGAMRPLQADRNTRRGISHEMGRNRKASL